MQDHTTNKTSQEIPYGYCHCGCGQKTAIANRDDKRWKQIKGQPVSFIRGHQARLNPPRFYGYADEREAFWHHVDPGPTNVCWCWRGATNSKGYGNLVHKRKHWHAHRLSYFIHNGQIPKGLHVLHHCDNPGCVNPSHLFVGTNDDNVADRQAKGRTQKGEQRPNRKLTENAAVLIRELYEYGVTKTNLSRLFNVSSSSIHAVIIRKVWKHV